VLVINLFGAPGAGKSSLAFLISAYLKMHYSDLSVECPNEIAKMVCYDEAPKALKCQMYIAGLQQWQIERCEGYVDIVVCDSPVLLSPMYAEEGGQNLPESFTEVCRHYHDKYPSLNYFVMRTHPYDTRARFHSEEDSKRIALKIAGIVSALPHHEVVFSSEDDARDIASYAAHLARQNKETNVS